MSEPMVPAMALALSASFGSVAGWRADALARVAEAGAAAGWLSLWFDPAQGRLQQQVLAAAPAADADADADADALLVLPLAPGAEAALEGIDWAAVYERYQHAVHAASSCCGAAADAATGALLLDVRRAGVFAQAPSMLPGARWHDPADVDRWAAALPRDTPVLVYCVYGHEVGRATALRLRAAGVNARYLSGGFHDWQAAGRPVVAKEGTP
ncbi:MAG: hypothetical protein HY855_20320 [Burkholderiales bacterium]|nr:hypothetical protein [Burkholderiales bacterium]